MIDYFDALLRSAGLGAAGTAATPPGLQAEAADLVELDQEVVVGPAPVKEGDDGRSAAPALPPADAPPVTAQSAPAAAEPAGEARIRPGEPARPPAAVAVAPEALPAQRIGPTQSAATIHPLVQAALHWVAADPQVQAQQTAAQVVPATAAPTTSPIRRPSAAEPQKPAAVEAQAIEPSPAPGPGPGRPAGPQQQPGAAPVRVVEPAPRFPGTPESVAVTEPATELHIGAIHVTVDAARAPVAPAVAAAPPMPPVPVRSAYLRSRAPRL